MQFFSRICSKAWIAAAMVSGACHAGTLETHYAPAENLEAIDVELINQAERSIDMAAYVLSDGAVIEALDDAADRGVAVRLYLDRGEFRPENAALAALIGRPGVEARLKASRTLMHMKAYVVDNARLRTGSGNFSRSSLSQQDNDLLVIDDAGAVGRFERDFNAIWTGGRTP